MCELGEYAFWLNVLHVRVRDVVRQAFAVRTLRSGLLGESTFYLTMAPLFL